MVGLSSSNPRPLCTLPIYYQASVRDHGGGTPASGPTMLEEHRHLGDLANPWERDEGGTPHQTHISQGFPRGISPSPESRPQAYPGVSRVIGQILLDLLVVSFFGEHISLQTSSLSGIMRE